MYLLTKEQLLTLAIAGDDQHDQDIRHVRPVVYLHSKNGDMRWLISHPVRGQVKSYHCLAATGRGIPTMGVVTLDDNGVPLGVAAGTEVLNDDTFVSITTMDVYGGAARQYMRIEVKPSLIEAWCGRS